MSGAGGHKSTYYRLAWSSDWNTRTPWSLDLRPMPYIGKRNSVMGWVSLTTLGPVAIIGVKV